MIGRVWQQWVRGAAGQGGALSRDYAASLREAGLPVARLQTLELAEGSEEARCVEAFLEELVTQGVRIAVDRVIWSGASREAFLGALEVMRADMLPVSVAGDPPVVTWLDGMVFRGRESSGMPGCIDLAERFYLLAHAGCKPWERLRMVFFSALCAGRADKIRPMCEAGANPNLPLERDTTPMCYAVRYNRPKVLVHLVEAGADPNLAGPDGHTPLSLAVKLGAFNCLLELKKLGADLERRHGAGQTVLHQAVADGDVRAVKVLLALGAKVNAACRSGRTPLHIAAHYGFDDVLVALLKAGADPMARDAYKCLPIHLAAERGYPGVVRLLESEMPGTASLPLHGQARGPLGSVSNAPHGLLAWGLSPESQPRPCAPGSSVGSWAELGDELDENLRF